MTDKFYLPSKVKPYLKRLDVEYARAGNLLLCEIIQSARVAVSEETEYDNWDGGTYGHDVLLFLPEDIFTDVSLQEQESLSARLKEDLNTCARAVRHEFFAAVHLEIIDEGDPACQRAVTLSEKAALNPDALEIWKPGYVRLFISHRDEYKGQAKRLSDALEEYGICGFVAHDTIQPMTAWQTEIIKGLETMEVMLTFITDNFHASTWTNQEVGYALGKGIPIISVKVQKEDPKGFIGSTQAVRAHLEQPEDVASTIYDLVANKLGQKSRAHETLISAFLNSRSFNEARDRFDRINRVIDSLSDSEVERIVDGFATNDQLHNAIYLINNYQRLAKFLARCTGKDVVIDGKKILVGKKASDALPF